MKGWCDAYYQIDSYISSRCSASSKKHESLLKPVKVAPQILFEIHSRGF